jgi:hypothetical protein
MPQAVQCGQAPRVLGSKSAKRRVITSCQASYGRLQGMCGGIPRTTARRNISIRAIRLWAPCPARIAFECEFVVQFALGLVRRSGM